MKRTLCMAVLVAVISVCVISEEYTVQKGDTLYSIAHEFGVRLDVLLTINGIEDPTALGVGTVIKIPRFHEVEKGDTIWNISRQYQSTVEDMIKINDFDTPHVLMVGDVVIVPGLLVYSQENVVGDRTIQIDDSSNSESNNESPGGATENAGNNSSGDEIESTRNLNSDSGESPDGVPSDTSADQSATNVASLAPHFWPITGERVEIEGKIPGTEFVGQPGDLVYAVSGGVVVWDAPNLNFGRALIVESTEGYYYVYGTEVVGVEIGQRVTAGARIGALGVNPNTGETKLFFTVYKNGKIIDPKLAPRG